MSWWVYLGKTKSVNVDSHEEGGTYCVGGTGVAELNITYNYSKHYYTFLDREEGLLWLHDKRAKDTISRLKKAIMYLGTTKDSDYWASTPGNAGHALNILLKWAKKHPSAKFVIH